MMFKRLSTADKGLFCHNKWVSRKFRQQQAAENAFSSQLNITIFKTAASVQRVAPNRKAALDSKTIEKQSQVIGV